MFVLLFVLVALGLMLGSLILLISLFLAVAHEAGAEMTLTSRFAGWLGFAFFAGTLLSAGYMEMKIEAGVRTGVFACLTTICIATFGTVVSSILYRGEGRWKLWGAAGVSCLLVVLTRGMVVQGTTSW